MAKTAVARQNNRTKNGGVRKSGFDADKTLVGVKKSGSTTRKDAQHVIELDGNWVVKSERSGRLVTQPYPDKREAIDAGRRLARELGNELLIHGRNGQIFQHSPVPSELAEDTIRAAIRSANEKTMKKAEGSGNIKKAARKK
jgi:hypothetical protein